MTSGWARFQVSGGSPNWSPLAKSIVPMAPSAMTGPPSSSRASKRARPAPLSIASRAARSGNATGSTSSAGDAASASAGASLGARPPRPVLLGRSMAGIIPTMSDATRAAEGLDLLAALRDLVARYLVDEGVPGIALAVTDRDGTVVSLVGGWADLDARRPVVPETLFEIGSIGKVFTAEIVLQLVDEGRLALDDPIVRHIPWFDVPRYGARITIHHLLGHTAGITAGVEGTPDAVMQVWRLRDLPPGSAPGRHVHYSNLGYKVLGLVIEAVDGVPFALSLQRRILDPWGMDTSAAAVSQEVRPRLAVGYEPARDDVPWNLGDPVRPGTWLTTGTADGCSCTNAEDLVAASRRFMADERGHVARMVEPQPVRGGEHQGYALATTTVGGRTFVGKGGGMIGYTAGLQWEPASGFAAVVLQNGPFGMPNALARLVVRMAA